MQIFLLTLAALAIIMAAMAIGVACTGRRLKGSCGGEGASECERTGVPIEQRACANTR